MERSLFGIPAGNLYRDSSRAPSTKSDKLYDTAQVLGPIKTKFGKHNTGFIHEKEIDRPRDLEHKIEEELADNVSSIAAQFTTANNKDKFNEKVAESIINAYGKDRYGKIKKEVDAHMIERFNKWLLGKGEDSEYFDPTNTAGKSWFIRNPNPDRKYSSKTGVMSEHPSVQKYIKDLVNPHVEHLQELSKRILMQGRSKTARQPTVKDLFDYYKYVIRGIDPKRDVLAGYLADENAEKGGLGAETHTVADMHFKEIQQTNELLKQLIKETTGLADRLTIRDEALNTPKPIQLDTPPYVPPPVEPLHQKKPKHVELSTPDYVPEPSHIITKGKNPVLEATVTTQREGPQATIIPSTRRPMLVEAPTVAKPPEAVIFAKPAPPPVDTSAAVLRQYARQKAAAIPTNIFPPAAAPVTVATPAKPAEATSVGVHIPPAESELNEFAKKYAPGAGVQLREVEYNGNEPPLVSAHNHRYNDNGTMRNMINLDVPSSLKAEEAKNVVSAALVRLENTYNSPEWGKSLEDIRSDHNPVYLNGKLIGNMEYNAATSKYEFTDAYPVAGDVPMETIANPVDADVPQSAAEDQKREEEEEARKNKEEAERIRQEHEAKNKSFIDDLRRRLQEQDRLLQEHYAREEQRQRQESEAFNASVQHAITTAQKKKEEEDFERIANEGIANLKRGTEEIKQPLPAEGAAPPVSTPQKRNVGFNPAEAASISRDEVAEMHKRNPEKVKEALANLEAERIADIEREFQAKYGILYHEHVPEMMEYANAHSKKGFEPFSAKEIGKAEDVVLDIQAENIIREKRQDEEKQFDVDMKAEAKRKQEDEEDKALRELEERAAKKKKKNEFTENLVKKARASALKSKGKLTPDVQSADKEKEAAHRKKIEDRIMRAKIDAAAHKTDKLHLLSEKEKHKGEPAHKRVTGITGADKYRGIEVLPEDEQELIVTNMSAETWELIKEDYYKDRKGIFKKKK